MYKLRTTGLAAEAHLERRERAACGVGLVAAISGEPSREVVDLALGALAAMEHRGGVGADGEASDGAGVLTAIPWRVLEPWLANQRDRRAAALLDRGRHGLPAARAGQAAPRP